MSKVVNLTYKKYTSVRYYTGILCLSVVNLKHLTVFNQGTNNLRTTEFTNTIVQKYINHVPREVSTAQPQAETHNSFSAPAILGLEMPLPLLQLALQMEAPLVF